MTEAIANALIPSVNCQIFGNPDDAQTMQQVMGMVMQAINDESVAWHLERFASYYRGHTQKQQLEKLGQLWHFVRHQIKYVEDGNIQIIKSPACTWQYRRVGADCKSKTVFIYWVCRLLQIPCFINFLIYNNNQGHVFPTAVIGNQLVRIDAVNTYFNDWNDYGFQNIKRYPSVFQWMLHNRRF